MSPSVEDDDEGAVKPKSSAPWCAKSKVAVAAQALAKAINATATEKNPWYVIPSDDKWYSRLIVSDILTKRLEKLPLAYPTMSPDQEKELNLAKQLLQDEDKY